MKRLSEFIVNEQNINEGFWDFLTSFFKSLFGDASPETKNYGERVLAHGNDEFGKQYQNEITKLLKQKDTKKFLESAEDIRKGWVENKTMEENESYAEMCFVLEFKKKLLNDSKKTSDIKLIDERIEEYKKKAGDALKKTQEKIKETDTPKEEGDNGAPSKEFEEATDKAFEEYKSEIDQLCNAGNTTPEQLKNVVFQLVKSDKELNTINESKTVFGLCIMAIGAKLAESFEGDYNVIAMFMGTVGNLAGQKKLN